MNIFRWVGCFGAAIGSAVSGLLLLAFLGMSQCPMAKILFSGVDSTCSTQRKFFYFFGPPVFIVILCILVIVFSRNPIMKTVASSFGVILGIALLWFLCYGMSGMFGGGLH
jgi:hypothetical protein